MRIARKRFSDFTIHYKKRRRRRDNTTVVVAATVTDTNAGEIDTTVNTVVTKLTEFKTNIKMARQFMDDNLNWHDEKTLSMSKINDFFRRNKMSLSVDTYETCDQTAKNTCNSVFKLAVEQFFWPTRSRSTTSINVLILDSGRFKTSKALEKAADNGGPGTHRMAIYIPNPFLFPTRPVVHAKRSNRPNGITSTKRVITNCSMGMFLHKLTNLHSEDLETYQSLKFRGIWLDYCCSLLGNSWSKPKDDIGILFKNGLFDIGDTGSTNSTSAATAATSTYAVLATTLCSRNARQSDSWISEKISNKLSAMQFIQETAAQYGYIALCKHEYVYKTMFFQLFYIYRQTLVGLGGGVGVSSDTSTSSNAMDVSD